MKESTVSRQTGLKWITPWNCFFWPTKVCHMIDEHESYCFKRANGSVRKHFWMHVVESCKLPVNVRKLPTSHSEN